MTRAVYLDHNATTPVLPCAREAMLDALASGWGNPSSAHGPGRDAADRLAAARAAVAAALGRRADRVVFVSGATEGLHHAVHAAGPGRVLASAVEHPALFAAVAARHDRALEELPVDAGGRVDPDDVLRRVDAGPRPALVAVMAANNETGILQPVEALVAPLRARGVPFLVDASQRAGRLPMAFAPPDLLVVTAHKLGGPKGAGALVLADGVDLPPLLPGGGQEGGRRGGTEPLPAIVGFGAAMAWVAAHRDTEAARQARLRDRLAEALLDALPGSAVVAAASPRLPNTLSFRLPPGPSSAAMVAALDAAGVAVSGGSACHAGSPRPSRVLTAMGLPAEEALRVLRLSLGPGTTEEDVALAVSAARAAWRGLAP